MEQPTNQTTPAQPQRPGHRDMMFCHECADEWYRDERGLTCPECGSDFTEIVSGHRREHDMASRSRRSWRWRTMASTR